MRNVLLPTVVALVSLLWGTAWTQVTRTETGGALDANYRIGSGGFNAPAPDPLRFNSQLYITGQVTGLSRFQGGVPYSAADELRLNLPSDRLSVFGQQSVGVPQVLTGSAYQITPYYQPSKTIFNIPRMAAGLAVPGGSAPARATIAPSLTRRLYREVALDYRSLMGTLPGRALSVVPPGPMGAIVPGIARRIARMRVSRPSPAAPFAVLRAIDRRELARELSKLKIYREEIETETAARTVLPSTIERTEALREGEAEFRREAPLSTEHRPLTEPLEPTAVEADQDVYLDVLRRLRERRTTRRKVLVLEAPLPERPLPAAIDSNRPARAGADWGWPARRETRRRLVEIEPDEDVVVIHGLAGISPDMFNQYMSAGSKKLKASEFYAAAKTYESAVAIDPENPMGRIGLGLARFGAGEPLSAALQLKRALRLLPPLMETHLDIPAMVDPNAVAPQLERLDARVGEGKAVQGQLAFLSAFMHHNLGHTEQAKSSARKLQKSAGDDRLMQAYAAHILTGATRLTTQPSTNPTTSPTP